MEQRYMLTDLPISIPCVLTCPDDGDIRRVVVSVHGLGGSTEDPIQCAIAEEMDFFRAATLRFDFPAHGINPLESPGFTLDNCTASLLAAAREAKSRFPQVEDLCIFATGFGAYVTLLCLEELRQFPGNIRLVIQTPSVLMHNTLLAMKQTTRETLWAMDSITFNVPHRPLTVRYAFYEELQQNIVLANHDMPMLILVGEEDNFIPMSDIQQFRRVNEQAKLVVIPGAGHRFEEEGAWDMVLDLTRDWFEYEQVFLTDWI